MATIVEDDVLKKYRKSVVTAFNSHYYDLSSALEGSMQMFAQKALAAALISPSVMKSKNFDSIATDFLAGLKLKDNVLDVQQYCQHFIDILHDVGGPAVVAAKRLSVRWNDTKFLTTVDSGKHKSLVPWVQVYSMLTNVY